MASCPYRESHNRYLPTCSHKGHVRISLQHASKTVIPGSQGILLFNVIQYCQLLLEFLGQCIFLTITRLSLFQSALIHPSPIFYFCLVISLSPHLYLISLYVFYLAFNNRMLEIWVRLQCLSYNTSNRE